MEKRFIVMIGLPGSGKSTIAKDMIKKSYDIVRINNDELRKMLFNRQYDEQDEQLVTKFRKTLLEETVRQGLSIIMDNTNLKPSLVEGYKNFAKKHGYKFEIIRLDTPLLTCIDRDVLRVSKGTFVGAKVIKSLFNKYLYPKQVCKKCGENASYGKEYIIEPYKEGICEVCGKNGKVCEPINFGNPIF